MSFHIVITYLIECICAKNYLSAKSLRTSPGLHQYFRSKIVLYILVNSCDNLYILVDVKCAGPFLHHLVHRLKKLQPVRWRLKEQTLQNASCGRTLCTTVADEVFGLAGCYGLVSEGSGVTKKRSDGSIGTEESSVERSCSWTLVFCSCEFVESVGVDDKWTTSFSGKYIVYNLPVWLIAIPPMRMKNEAKKIY